MIEDIDGEVIGKLADALKQAIAAELGDETDTETTVAVAYGAAMVVCTEIAHGKVEAGNMEMNDAVSMIQLVHKCCKANAEAFSMALLDMMMDVEIGNILKDLSVDLDDHTDEATEDTTDGGERE